MASLCTNKTPLLLLSLLPFLPSHPPSSCLSQPQPNFRRVTINGSSLTIEQLRFTDTATYECVASSVLGETRRAFSLTVSREYQTQSANQMHRMIKMDELTVLGSGCSLEISTLSDQCQCSCMPNIKGGNKTTDAVLLYTRKDLHMGAIRGTLRSSNSDDGSQTVGKNELDYTLHPYYTTTDRQIDSSH